MKKNRFLLSILIADIFIVSISFFLLVWVKPASLRYYLPNYIDLFVPFLAFWVFISFIFKKYHSIKNEPGILTRRKILFVNIFITSVVLSLIIIFDYVKLSRLIWLGTIIASTLLETIMLVIIDWYRESIIVDQDHIKKLPKSAKAKRAKRKHRHAHREVAYNEFAHESISKTFGDKVFDHINSYLNIDSTGTLVLSTSSHENIDLQPWDEFDGIINLERINNIRYLNKFFESSNRKLDNGGLFIIWVETKDERKRRLLKKYPKGFNYVYYSFDFIFKRFFPKFSLTKRTYFLLTRGNNRVISRAEALGRLYSCGFEIVNETEIDNRLFVVAKKVGDPVFDMNPTYGPLISLRRIGKEGKLFRVYKMRTMHPYSEYLQDYVYKLNSLQEGGKFKDDFRVTTLGKFARKVWLDELPMVWNFIKGNMKIVGVRPLSRHYFSLYSEELQELRTRVKPGLIPPFYVDNPVTLEEIMESEKKYLNAYLKKPLRTDIKYFWKAFYNIVFKKARSN